MASPHSIGEGTIIISEDGSRKYRGKIRSGVRRDEMISLVRSRDLDYLEREASVAPQITEPISKHEAEFPAKMFLNTGNEPEHGSLFDGYKYYKVNSIWVRYHHVEKSNGILKRTSQYSMGDGVIVLSKDRFYDFKGEIWGDVQEDERLSLIRARDLDALERAIVTAIPQIVGPISRHEAFPNKWPLDKDKKLEHRFLLDRRKYSTKDSIWVRYHPVEA